MGRDRMTPQLAKGGYDPAQVTPPRVLSSRDRLGSPSKFLKNIPIFLRMLGCCEGFDGERRPREMKSLWLTLMYGRLPQFSNVVQASAVARGSRNGCIRSWS